MRGKLAPIVALALALVAPAALVSGQGDEASSPEWEPIATGLAQPVSLEFGPDGSLYYTELKEGGLRVIEPGASAPNPEPVHTVAVSPGGNGGFLGLEVAADFHESGAFYVYYTTKEDGEKFNRVSRLDANGETVLLDRIPWAEMHDGGRLLLVDGKLLVTTGDNEKRSPAQDDGDILGKILRLNPDGSVPEDNPVAGNPMWAKGVRNPFGICQDADTLDVWFTDNGPARGDELNLLRKGANYGWPHAVGNDSHEGYEAPAVAWEKTYGPTGCAAVNGTVYIGDFVQSAVRTYDAETGEHRIWSRSPGSPHVLDVEVGPEGALYVSTYDGIFRLALPDSGPRPMEPLTDPDNGVGYHANGTQDENGESPEEATGEQETPGPGLALSAGAVAFAAAGCRKKRTAPRRRRSR